MFEESVFITYDYLLESDPGYFYMAFPGSHFQDATTQCIYAKTGNSMGHLDLTDLKFISNVKYACN